MKAQAIRAHLDERLASLKIETFSEIDSTNTYAKQQAAVDRRAALYVADSQTAGRGRFGRQFYSPKETGIYFTLAMPWNRSVEEVMLLTPAAAVAVSEALEREFGVEAQIKWVNDIFVGGKKVCGILSESVISSAGEVSNVVIGIGINLKNPKQGFPKELEGIAGSVSGDADQVDEDALELETLAREKVSSAGVRGEGMRGPRRLDDERKAAIVAAVVNQLGRHIAHLTERGFLEGYRTRSLLQGKEVRLSDGREGVVVDVDEDCGLVVEGEDGLFVVRSGEASAQKKKRKPDT